jgi:hypothetical protein
MPSAEYCTGIGIEKCTTRGVADRVRLAFGAGSSVRSSETCGGAERVGVGAGAGAGRGRVSEREIARPEYQKGPIVPCDQVGDPQSLRIACRVNGETSTLAIAPSLERECGATRRRRHNRPTPPGARAGHRVRRERRRANCEAQMISMRFRVPEARGRVLRGRGRARRCR